LKPVVNAKSSPDHLTERANCNWSDIGPVAAHALILCVCISEGNDLGRALPRFAISLPDKKEVCNCLWQTTKLVRWHAWIINGFCKDESLLQLLRNLLEWLLKVWCKQTTMRELFWADCLNKRPTTTMDLYYFSVENFITAAITFLIIKSVANLFQEFIPC